MSTTYKTFLDDDIVTSRALLHENIPITGTVLFGAFYDEEQIKTYNHGIFYSVFDYPHTSSAANHLFDMTAGLTVGSPGSSSIEVDPFVKKKINSYNQAAQVLVGYGSDGSILQFDRDGNQASGLVDDKFTSVFILNFSRLLVKDEIKKNSFKLTLGIGEDPENPFAKTCLISDASSSLNYYVNSPTGEYGALYCSQFSDEGAVHPDSSRQVGLIFYQAGIAIISTAIFAQYNADDSPEINLNNNKQGQLTYTVNFSGGPDIDIEKLFKEGTIEDINDALRGRIQNLALNNTTELNSTIHFCRVGHRDFNYSSNPTYLKNSKIVVKNSTTDAPVSYITTVGLYSPDNVLLAVAKLSEPIRKDPTQELILRVRLDY